MLNVVDERSDIWKLSPPKRRNCHVDHSQKPTEGHQPINNSLTRLEVI